MNKFEASLLQTLSSIDESLKALAGRRTAPAKVLEKAAAKTAPKVTKMPGNGAMPKAAAKAAKALAKAKDAEMAAKAS